MSESLNRAFLKAYDKEKTSEAKRQASAEEQRSREVAELVMHFDTTSVSIPAPHFLKPKSREGVLAGVTTSAASAQQVAKPVAIKQPVAMEVNSEDDLRDSIALQMMQAGAWEGQRIDAFIGGFPMLTTSASPTASPVSPTRATVVAAHQELTQNTDILRKSPGVEVVPMVQASMSSTSHSTDSVHTVAPNSVASSPAGAMHVPAEPAMSSPRSPMPEEAPRVQPIIHTHSASLPESPLVVIDESQENERHEQPVATATPESTYNRIHDAVPELQSPQSPALMHTVKPPHNTGMFDQQRPPTTLENHLAQRSRGGEIFRLDRPSYQQTVPSTDQTIGRSEQEATQSYATTDQDDSSDSYLDLNASRMIKPPRESTSGKSPASTATGSAATATATATATQRSTESNYQHSKRLQPIVDQTREVEEKLRRARVRIFNPVWEVDSLQWPPVCLQLLERMDGSLQHVANNLMTACQEGLQILAVTSPQRGEGTTTVACCLALLAGSHGLNVAIVDGDIEKPSLSYQTNLDVEQDWRSAILHQLPLEEIAVHSIDDQVTLVPLLNPISHHELSTDDDRIKLMMQELSESFDLVILDAGRMDSARSLVTALGERGIISAAVAVVDHRCSTPDRIESCLRRIRQSGISSIGLVENFAA